MLNDIWLVQENIVKHFGCMGVARGAKGTQILSISSHFVFWESASQTKYCCSPKIKHFGPPKFFGLATPLFGYFI